MPSCWYYWPWPDLLKLMFELIYPYDPAPVLPLPTADNPGSHARPGCEMVPVVEENGLVIGQAARIDVHGGTMLLHPVIHLHIINRNGELFIQRRSFRKRSFPGMWDTAVGGHIDYGELLETALFREASEELGFRGFNLDPHNEEVLEGRYWSMEEIEASIGKGLFTPNFEQEFASIKDTLLALL